jgi:hypothetical protein
MKLCVCISLPGNTGLVGPVGYTGPQGPMGYTGFTGLSGAIGATGLRGPIGETGKTLVHRQSYQVQLHVHELLLLKENSKEKVNMNILEYG